MTYSDILNSKLEINARMTEIESKLKTIFIHNQESKYQLDDSNLRKELAELDKQYYS